MTAAKKKPTPEMPTARAKPIGRRDHGAAKRAAETLPTVAATDANEACRVARQLARRNLAASHPVVVYLMSLSPGGRETMMIALRTCAKLLGSSLWAYDWSTLTPAEIAGLRSVLASRYAPATANRHLCAVRGVLRNAARFRLISREAVLELCDLPPVRGRRLPKGRALTHDELAVLMRLADDGDPYTLRAVAGLAICYGCGLRRAEAASIDVSAASDWRHLTIIGKGNAQRAVPVPERTRRAILAWLSVRGEAPGPLFCLIRHGQRGVRMKTAERATPSGFYDWFRTLADRAGVERFSPHDLRRTYVGDLLDQNVDLHTVQTLVGHADPGTTARYDRRPERVRASAVAKLDAMGWAKDDDTEK